KRFVDSQLEFVGLDCGILSISHWVTFPINVALWRDLMRGCRLSSGRFSYTTIGQSVKQQNSEGNALRTREKVLRSHISTPAARLTARTPTLPSAAGRLR